MSKKTNRVYENSISFVNKEGKESSFIAEDGSIDLETLESTFASIMADAKKSNKGNGAAGRRFRCNSLALGKVFLPLRKATPVK